MIRFLLDYQYRSADVAVILILSSSIFLMEFFSYCSLQSLFPLTHCIHQLSEGPVCSGVISRFYNFFFLCSFVVCVCSEQLTQLFSLLLIVLRKFSSVPTRPFQAFQAQTVHNRDPVFFFQTHVVCIFKVPCGHEHSLLSVLPNELRFNVPVQSCSRVQQIVSIGVLLGNLHSCILELIFLRDTKTKRSN